ncbi:ankyrin repeat and fibronectin type-III domain-containing protein 1 isoform X3 [Planococcus citri]|uniref:ankyrin repeat and fibronectin type-III domain-containing protein 1 isoform X3 n=1 Tax=Planococcus citri TaxID=170843 RepID=UPI0031F87031
MDKEDRKDSTMSSSPGLTIDKAAFLLLRVKRVFRKKKQQRKEKSSAVTEEAAHGNDVKVFRKRPPPLVRSRTLPAIVVPGLNILQAQIESKYKEDDYVGCSNKSHSFSCNNYLGNAEWPLNCHRLSSPDPSAGFMDDLKISSPRHSNAGFSTKFSKFLVHRQDEGSISMGSERRHSWERDAEDDDFDTANLPRSASIDSIVETKHCVSLVRRLPSPLLHRCPASPPPRPHSPNTTRRVKSRRAVASLFAAVEHGYVEKTKSILESSEVDVNSVNSDGLSPLDVAVLSNNKPLVKVLVTYGAQEGRKFYSADDMRNHLYHLLHEAERRVQELGSSLRLNIESDGSSLSSSSSNIPSITVGDSGSGGGSGSGGSQNKTYSIWERRAKGLKRMLMGFEQIRPPDPPATVNVEVTSVSSLMVYFQESESKNSSVTTKFRVQWSTDKDFCSLCGHYEVADTRQMRYHINNLRKGQSYYVRVASGNIKGYSAYKLSTPLFIVPSSWQDVTDKDIRFSSGMKETFDDVFGNVVVQHPYLKSNVELYGQGGELLVNQQRRKKTTIKQLFTAASKFQKHLRRGVYLSCLLYHEDKVLVTNEDFLPVIEVDETYPKKIHNDFHWFFKVVFSWSDLKWLKTDMEKSQNSGAVFRIKLLQAAAHMQTALSIQELGKLYHKLVRDAEGTIVISVINYIHSPKSVSVLNLRWLPLAKLTKRTNIVNVAESNVADILMSSIPDQITYHQVSSIKLPRGLYLSYLKMRSSVDSLQVLVPSRAPNIPPHCKIRDNPHVTAEEWEWLVKKENLRESLTNATHQQRLFIEQIAVTARRLFTYMEVPEEDAANHRLYDAEVIEVSKDVSLIMVVPPVEAACSMPGQRELLLQRSDLLPLTVQVFEMVHFGTYQLDLISTYSRLSCIIEMDIDLAQHSLRKAFSSSELSSAKSKLSELENLHTQLNTSWKRGRWLLDAISFARDRLSLSPTNMRHLLNVHPKRTLPSNESHCYLQPPDPKTAKSRGSWPGVGVGRHLGRMPNEISRSEQHLTCDTLQNTQPSMKLPTKPPSPVEVIATDSESGIDVVTTSRSEDTLTKLTDDQTAQKYDQSTPLTAENSSSGSLHSVSLDELLTPPKVADIEEEKDDDGIRVPVPSSAVLQVHAAYNTGLDNLNVNFKFQVNSKTTARELVELFIKQTNMSALLKGREPVVYTEEDTSNFCLVSVIGARERCLRDDFKPVQLQSPWNSGRLYVRRKSNVLAAIECDSKQSSSYV